MQLGDDLPWPKGIDISGKRLLIFSCNTFEPTTCAAIGLPEKYYCFFSDTTGEPRQLPFYSDIGERWWENRLDHSFVKETEKILLDEGYEEEWEECKPILLKLLKECKNHIFMEDLPSDLADLLDLTPGDDYDYELALPAVSGFKLSPFEGDYRQMRLAQKDPVIGQFFGTPEWVQSEEVPQCTCGEEMHFVAQFEQHGGGGINFGDSGCGYLFLCVTCTKARFIMQCC